MKHSQPEWPWAYETNINAESEVINDNNYCRRKNNMYVKQLYYNYYKSTVNNNYAFIINKSSLYSS